MCDMCPVMHRSQMSRDGSTGGKDSPQAVRLTYVARIQSMYVMLTVALAAVMQ